MTRSELEEALAAGEPLRVVRVAGKLVTWGSAEVARSAVEAAGADRERLAADALAALDFDALAPVLVEVLRLAPGLVGEPDETQRDRIAAALRERDDIEYALAGIELLVGHPATLDHDQTAALMSFDEVLRPEAWRLCPMNDERQRAAAALAPEHRDRFWWWTLGSDFPSDALEQLATAADLIAAFPAARGELERLAGAAGWLRNVPGRRPEVTSLRAWVAARRGIGAKPTAMAVGFSAGETTLLDEPDYQVSWQDPDRLIIDLIADPAPGERPSLSVGGRTLMGESVPDAVERYVIVVDAAALEAPGAELTLPLAKGLVKRRLAPA